MSSLAFAHIPMKKLSSIVCALAAACALTPTISTAAGVGTGPSFKGPIGLQLYSLRAQFTKNVPETMAMVQGFGVKEVELAGTYNLSPEKFNELLKANKLQAISGHFAFERYQNEPEVVAKEAYALGLKYAGVAWIPHGADFTEADLKKAVEVFNKAGKYWRNTASSFSITAMVTNSRLTRTERSWTP